MIQPKVCSFSPSKKHLSNLHIYRSLKINTRLSRIRQTPGPS